jgi:hypothetical protein
MLIIEEYHCYQLHTKFYPTTFSPSYIHKHMKLSEIITVSFDVTDQLLTIYLHTSDTDGRMGVLRDSTPAIHRLQESL